MHDIINKLEDAVNLIDDAFAVNMLREAIEAIEKLQAQVVSPCSGCQDQRRFNRHSLIEG